MNVSGLAEVFEAAKIAEIENEFTLGVKVLLDNLAKDGSIAESIPLLTQYPNAIATILRARVETLNSASTIYSALTRSLTAATPAFDPLEVLL